MSFAACLGRWSGKNESCSNDAPGKCEAAVTGATFAITIGTLLCLLLVTAAGFTITRSLTSQIGAAVQHMQSSSGELQAAANQQATGAKEQATAMNEITTTMSELRATSKQIAESAQRVAHIAEETGKGARSGEQTVSKANDSIGSIKRQVDLIVTHMLELGKKSQQIGGILEIINELAEQTNILAINATIEAAGAGESGKRFAVVADEIRKLADRVGGSTKEIRGLIDEIRAAVNTTVMTTEGGTKAVDAGARQFSDVATAFRQIASLVGTTTEAAREIELSTKQQSTAVEQVQHRRLQRRAGDQGDRDQLEPDAPDSVPARQPFTGPAAAGSAPGRTRSRMAKDPYQYFRVEARELLDGLAQGILQLEKGTPPRPRSSGSPAAPGAHAQGRRSCGQAAWDRRAGAHGRRPSDDPS
jgi:uncharacterized protein YukE